MAENKKAETVNAERSTVNERSTEAPKTAEQLAQEDKNRRNDIAGLFEKVKEPPDGFMQHLQGGGYTVEQAKAAIAEWTSKGRWDSRRGVVFGEVKPK